jgi:hypothetical protein
MSVLEASAWMVGTPRVPGAVGTPSPACHSEPVHEAAPSGETQARPLSMKFQYMVGSAYRLNSPKSLRSRWVFTSGNVG